MKKKCILLFAVFLFFPSGVVWADVDEDSFAVRITTHKYILDNGMTVLISEMPSSAQASLYALVKTGSATEGKFLGTGISHFLEHMVFKGTKKRGVGDISREIQALGGVINASTSFDYTMYKITVPYRNLEQALDIMADALMHSTFDSQEIEKEREVIYGEMRLYKDRPARYLSRLVFNTVYIRHPYRLPIIGHEELLRELRRDDFLAYYRKHYIPNNIVFSVSGRVEASALLRKITAVFKDFERQRYPSRNLPPEPEQISPRRYEEEYSTELTRMSMGFAGVSVLNKDMFALDVLAMVLGQGESSRLYLDLFKKKKLVHSVSSSNFTPMDQGIFEVECILEKENIESTIREVKAHIQRITRKGVEPAELKKAKRRVLSDYIHRNLTADSVAYSAAVDEAFIGDHDFSKKYVTAIRNVTNEDIKRVAGKYLINNNLSVVVLRPQETKREESRQREAQGVLAIKRIVLENGLTLLLRENHMFPLVSMSLVLNGGTLREDARSNGISRLTSQTWVKGTKSRTAEDIAESVESLGGALSGFSGRNSLGLTLNVLSDDLEFGINLLEDLVKNPSFDKREFVKEKEKARTIIIAQGDDAFHITAKALRETLFQTHPFRLETMGTLESVEKITRREVFNFYNKFSSPRNMVLSIFGDFDASKIEGLLTKKFGFLKEKQISLPLHTESAPEKTREVMTQLDKEQAIVMIGFQGVDFLHKDRHGLEVLSAILGSSFSGRIFNKVREELGEAYTLGGGFLPGKDMGIISFYVATTDESVLKVKDILLDLINEIREDVITNEELHDVKSYLTGRFKREIETDASLGFISALDELYGAGYDYHQRYTDKLNRITAEDIRRLAQTYLDVKKAAIVIARPKVKK